VRVKIHALATERQYSAHVAPVWAALPDDLRGDFLTVDRHYRFGDDGVIVGAHRDLRRVTAREVVFVEHGAGQTYDSDHHPSNSGGFGRHAVTLFVCPSDTVAARNLAEYPNAQAVSVGNPSLDPWHKGERGNVEADLAVIAFHWDNTTWPESRSALRYYAASLAATRHALATRGIRLMGHAHPRARREVSKVCAKAGAPFIEHYAEVLDRAAVLAVDNSSAGYEFCSLGRPLVWLNAPWYRRDIEHGLRFWSLSHGGLHVDDPADLADAIERSLRDDPCVTERERVNALVYEHTDGTAASRAADAIAALAAERVA
jgi:hypothetical protein